MVRASMRPYASSSARALASGRSGAFAVPPALFARVITITSPGEQASGPERAWTNGVGFVVGSVRPASPGRAEAASGSRASANATRAVRTTARRGESTGDLLDSRTERRGPVNLRGPDATPGSGTGHAR